MTAILNSTDEKWPYPENVNRGDIAMWHDFQEGTIIREGGFANPGGTKTMIKPGDIVFKKEPKKDFQYYLARDPQKGGELAEEEWEVAIDKHYRPVTLTEFDAKPRFKRHADGTLRLRGLIVMNRDAEYFFEERGERFQRVDDLLDAERDKAEEITKRAGVELVSIEGGEDKSPRKKRRR